MSQDGNRDSKEGTRLDGQLSFLDRFRQLPNLFFQACVQKTGRNRLESTLQTIRNKQARRQTDPQAAELQDEEDPENVAVFLLWILGEKREAEERAARAVREHPRQLLALSNWAYILWHNGKTEEAERYLATIEQLRNSDPSAYDDLDYEAQSELLYLYIKLGHSFKPFVVSEFQERLLARRPQDSRMKFTLALTLRRYNQRDYASAYPNVDFTKGLCRAADLLMEIKNDQTNSLDLRGKAAAELGEIVFQDKDKKKGLGLSPRDCYEEAVRLAPNNPPVLNRAGKFFRFQKDLNKSRELLERAISVTLDPTAHHQLGLTYKEIALQQANGHQSSQMGRGGGRRGRGRTVDQYRDWRSLELRRDDRNVQQAIFHFRKSLEIHHEDNKGALQALGLILMDIGDYHDALEQFVIIAEAWPVQIYHVYQAFENAGKVLQAISRSRDDLLYRETSVICFTISLAIQCLSFLSEIESYLTTINPNIWASLGDLTTVMSKDKNFFQNLKQCSKQEKILLWSLMNNWSTLPALTTLSRLCKIQPDRDKLFLEKIQDCQTRGDFAGALLLRSLLNMTLKNDGRFRITHDDVKGLLKTAQWLANLHWGQRESGSNSGDEDLKTIISRITLAASHVLCRLAFQDSMSLIKNSAFIKTSSGRSAALGDLSLSGNLEVDHGQYGEEAAGDDDVYSGNLHVLFLYDPNDQEAERDVSFMERLLEDVCGLKISRLSGPAEVSRGEAEVVTGRVCDERAVDESAELRVFVVKSKEMSSEYTSLIHKATKAGNFNREGAAVFTSLPPLRPSHVLLLNSAPLPEILNGHRFISTWNIPPEVEVSLSESRSSRAEVEAAYSLFDRLFGLTDRETDK